MRAGLYELVFSIIKIPDLESGVFSPEYDNFNPSEPVPFIHDILLRTLSE